jgi:hypothetical protein
VLAALQDPRNVAHFFFGSALEVSGVLAQTPLQFELTGFEPRTLGRRLT